MTLPTFFSPNLSPRVQCLTLTPPSLLVSHGFDHLSGSGGFILSLLLPLSIQTRWEWRGQEEKPVAAVGHGFGKEHVLQSCWQTPHGRGKGAEAQHPSLNGTVSLMVPRWLTLWAHYKEDNSTKEENGRW